MIVTGQLALSLVNKASNLKACMVMPDQPLKVAVQQLLHAAFVLLHHHDVIEIVTTQSARQMHCVGLGMEISNQSMEM